jgi:hypothetical protein
MCNKKGRINMELKELLSSMSMEELMSARQKVNTEIECRREGERSRLEDELKKLVKEIRRSGFHVEIDVGDNCYQDDEWEEISVEY